MVLLAVMVASNPGYKMYGKATVIDNRTLTKKTSIIAMFEKPNLVITEGGDRIVIKDFELSDFALQLSLKEISSSLSQPDYVHVVANSAFPSGYAIEVRNRYGCGNTFFPRWLPQRLPKYQMKDLGEVLRRSYLSADAPEWSNTNVEESPNSSGR